MEIYKKFFGKKLKEALNASGHKQFELADELEINASAVSQWISGKDFPDDSRLPDICRFLKLDPSYFTVEGQMSASELVSILNGNMETVRAIQTIPNDIIRMLANQDDIFFASLRRTLEIAESKKTPRKEKKSLPS